MKLSVRERLHMRHRLWRYRFKSERPSLEYLSHCELAGKTILDIGANFGVFSYYMSKAAGTDGRLLAFEPQPELGTHLDAVKETYHLNNLTVVKQGLSSSPGILKMRRSAPGSGGASFHYEPAEHLEELDVPVTTLDKFLSANTQSGISFIKCDVEEHELEVFRGGEQTLLKHMPTLLFECHDKEAEAGEIFSYLTNLDYDGFFFFVRPSDHKSLLRNNRGEFRHFSEFSDYPYPRPSVRHRNYVFLKKGLRPK
jgi:FkbM family methyltransferase